MTAQTRVRASDLREVDSLRMPIGGNTGTKIDLLSIGSFRNHSYPKIRFRDNGDGNGNGEKWYVATAFNRDRWLNNGWDAEPSLGPGSYYDDFSGGGADFHPGEDWNLTSGGQTDAGQDVYSIAEGIVLYSGKVYGNSLIIAHKLRSGEIITSFYGHLMDGVSLVVGARVTTDKPIAKVGNTGTAFAHLHFEIRKQSLVRIDPMTAEITLATHARRWPASIPGTTDNGRGFISANFYEPSLFLKQEFSGPHPPPVVVPNIPTLFMFDVSGSMKENNKIGQAREAGLDALREMDEGGAGSVPVSIMTFAGPCSPDSVKTEHQFMRGTTAARPVMGRIQATDGATPLPQAKSAAEARMLLQLQMSLTGREGRVILLSDGQSTCGDIRPPGVFIRPEVFSVTAAGMTQVRFLTIGFDITPGSAAERDLQYLAATTGGRYYNAANREGLARALRKHVRVYRPRACNTANATFTAGIESFADNDYQGALVALERYALQNPADWCGQYNLALALEANDRYRRAGESYGKYLSLAPSSPDRPKIETKIAEMQAEYASFLDYQIRVIQSDRDYLRGPFWESIFNNKSSDVADEFAGFVFEKGDFYANLPQILEIEERWLVNDARNISSSMRALYRRRNQPTFDSDAVSLLTTPVGQIEDMLERLREFRSTITQ